MATLSEMVGKHFEAAVAEAAGVGYGKEDAARTMLAFVMQAYRESRPASEIAAELRGIIDSLDPEAEFTFDRP